ncbi:MAG: tyrosine/phenylalanine carboxypeptidase domain-containing protein, partial [Spirochaetota bacterium]
KATRYMLSGYSFRRSYQLLAETGLITPDTAFYMTARVYRGGGFTKDYLYLRGFREVLKLYRERPQSIPSLLIGKTSLPYLSTIEQMIERTLLYRPEFVTHSFTETGSPDPIMEYIVSGIR